MGRLPIVDPDDPNTDPLAKALLLAVRQNLQTRGTDLPWQDINVYSAMANHPKLLEGILTFGSRAYSNNSLTPAQRELAYLGASVANDCHY
jgi:alkylhydroperoxidase family enzyme